MHTFQEGDRVRVIKSRAPGDAIVGKTGTILGSTEDLKLFWIVRLYGKTYIDSDAGDLLHTDEIELIGRVVKFGQFEICLSDVSYGDGWSYYVRYAPKYQLVENPFAALPRGDYGTTFEDAILDAKKQTLEAVEKQICLKRRQVAILESAMESIEGLGVKV